MSGASQHVHLRVNDAATGKPTPVRLRCAGADGTYYAPFGRLQRLESAWSADCGGNVIVDGKLFAYIDGACELRLPLGPVTVEVHKGPEYIPLLEKVQLTAGKLAFRLTIRRWTDERQQGWYAGEFGAHALTPHAALLEAAGEDLAVVNLLAHEREVAGGGVTPNLLAFSGQQPALERPGHLVAVNTLNRHALLGELALLHAHRVVHPLRFGGNLGLDDWTLADWCEQCHRKAGLVVWSDLATRPLTAGSLCGETLADALLGKIDAVRVHLNQLADWYDLLGGGFAGVLCAGSDRSATTPLGQIRTYAQLRPGEECNYKNWIEAVRGGRTYLTEGPLLHLSVGGSPPGSWCDLPEGTKSVRVTARARSFHPFDALELVAHGEVIARVQAGGSPWEATLDREVSLAQSGWLAARCLGERSSRVVAHTSPVFVRVDNQPLRPPAATALRWTALLERMMAWCAEEANCASDAERQRLRAVFEQALRVVA